MSVPYISVYVCVVRSKLCDLLFKKKLEINFKGPSKALSLRVDGKCGLVLDGNDRKCWKNGKKGLILEAWSWKWRRMVVKMEKMEKKMLKNGPSSWEAFSVLNLPINCY